MSLERSGRESDRWFRATKLLILDCYVVWQL